MSSPRFRNQDVDGMRSKVYLYRGRLYDKLSTAKSYRTSQRNLYPATFQEKPDLFIIYEGTVTYEKLEID